MFFRVADRIGGKGQERVYYVVFKKDVKVYEEKVGRQSANDMTPARAIRIRAERIEGKRSSGKEIREKEAAQKAAEANRWIISRLFAEYIKSRPDNKGRKVDSGRFDKYLKPTLGDKEPNDLLPLDVDRLRLKLLKKLKPQTVSIICSRKRGCCRNTAGIWPL